MAILNTVHPGTEKVAVTENITSVGAGKWIIVAENVKHNISVELKVTSGTGKVQTTMDSRAAMEADTADAIDWNKGTISATDDDVIIGAVTGIRGNLETAGDITIKVVA